jgi:hypothetical protein
VVGLESRRRDARFVLISLGSGLFTGVLAGLVGLGGAEERIPFILYPLKAPLHDMIVANLIISFATSAVSFTLRLGAGLVTVDALTIGAAMIVGSLAGAYAGSVVSHRLSERRLKAAIALILSLVVARLVLDLLGGVSFSFGSIRPALELPVAAFFGLLVGVVSGRWVSLEGSIAYLYLSSSSGSASKSRGLPVSWFLSLRFWLPSGNTGGWASLPVEVSG